MLIEAGTTNEINGTPWVGWKDLILPEELADELESHGVVQNTECNPHERSNLAHGGAGVRRERRGKERAHMTITTGNKARVLRYRALHRRIDYVPSPDVLQIIEHHLRVGTDICLAGVIDYLIRSGQQAISGNGGR